MKRQVRKDISPLLSAFDTKKFGVVASVLLAITVIDMVFSFAAYCHKSFSRLGNCSINSSIMCVWNVSVFNFEIYQTKEQAD